MIKHLCCILKVSEANVRRWFTPLDPQPATMYTILYKHGYANEGVQWSLGGIVSGNYLRGTSNRLERYRKTQSFPQLCIETHPLRETPPASLGGVCSNKYALPILVSNSTWYTGEGNILTVNTDSQAQSQPSIQRRTDTGVFLRLYTVIYRTQSFPQQ